MKYSEIKGDLFYGATQAAKQSPNQILVHGCNAIGVMGAGVARVVRETWPRTFETYRDFCQSNDPDNIVGTFTADIVENDLVVVNAITQKYTGQGRQVDYEGVANAFEVIGSVVINDLEDQPTTIHMPMIGAGLGGGNWTIIKTIIQETMKPYDGEIRVYHL